MNCILLQQNFPDSIFLKGNHEEMFKEARKSINELQFWVENGGISTLNSFRNMFGNSGLEDKLPNNVENFLNNLKIKFETDDYLFTHAGIDSRKNFYDQDDVDYLWSRNLFHSEKMLPKTVVCGHTVDKKVRMTDDRICIDTGAFFYGKMSCILLPERNVITIT